MNKIAHAKYRWIIGAIVVGSIFSIVHAAGESVINWNDYDIYYGDFNADNNNNDIYFRGKSKLLILPGDIATPLVLPAPGGFVLFQNTDGSHSDAIPMDYPDSMLVSAQKAQITQDYVIGDLNNDGSADALIRGRTISSVSVLLAGGPQQLEPVVLAEIASDGRTYSRANGWSSDVRVTQNPANRTNPLSLAPGRLSIGDGAYALGGTQGIIAYNSVETVFEYDELGRLRKLQSSDGANVSYIQDKENNFTATVKTQSGQ